MKTQLKAFSCYPQADGVYFTYPNGISISIRWDYRNYADNHDKAITWSLANIPNQTESDTAEILIRDKDGKNLTSHFTGECDVVKGYVSITEVTEILNKIMKYKEA